ncbi:hypothetical protein KVT40_005711 [Elsinoe batatas]|uniref:Protein arginine methyltransferase NDUFAF7 n=1 Tax=Elsinoe batatas TaxID=2601811 RepID=A0A8K0L322_9PEZI|nr:hypothetical protein KVT40_005711 [Elsinoe batatas]
MRSRLTRLGRLCDTSLSRSGTHSTSCAGARWNSSSTRQWSTPLAKTLSEVITTTGPIPVASYMRQCLTSDLGGYYTSETPDRDQFGRKGDFVTSPEISQIFGELVGLWIVAEWIAQGRKDHGVYLMEVGPGRGTLMDDVMRTIRNFKDLVSALDGVYLVEASPPLREAQHKLLCGDNALTKTETGHESRSKYDSDLQVIWCEDVRLLPQESDKTPFIVAHEFFDALPIHVFQSIAPNPTGSIQTPTGPIEARNLPRAARHQWRELLVSPTSPYATHASLGTPKSLQAEPVLEFELTLAKAATPHSLYLPEQSERYGRLKSTSNAIIEVSPESQTYAADFAVRIGGGKLPTPNPIQHAQSHAKRVSQPRQAEMIEKAEPSGAALIIDYGPADTIPSNSLRGIKAHKRVSPFTEPGRVDLSADVDFLALAESALEASPGVEVHGPLDQARFLTAMGIEERATQLVKRAVDQERGAVQSARSQDRTRTDLTEIVKRIESGWKRLVDRGPHGMGKLYQVMAIVPYKSKGGGQPIRRPVGFGGDIPI